MTTFRPISPSKAIELVESAGVANARRLIRDYAAAGLVRASAIVIETIEVTGERSESHGEMAKGLWERIVHDGVDEDVWIGGMVRLPASELIGGAPAVNITGIRFNVMDLQRLILSQRGYGIEREEAPSSNRDVTIQQAAIPEPGKPEKPVRRGKTSGGLRSGALVASVNEAAVALNRGRTTIYKMLNEGKLKRAPDGKQIDVASVKAAAGIVD